MKEKYQNEQIPLQAVEQLTPLLESLTTHVTLVDSELIILSINRTAPGLEPSDVVGHSILEFVEPEFHDLARRSVEKVFSTGETIVYESAAYGPGGTRAWYENHLGPVLRDGQISAVLFFGIDVSERKAAEKGLSDREQTSRLLFERAPVAIWHEDATELGQAMDELRAQGVKDLRAHLVEHPQDLPRMLAMLKVVSVNDAALDMFGANSQNELVESLPELFNENSYEAVTEEMVTLWEGRTFFESHTQHGNLAGQTVHFIVRMMVVEHEGQLDLSNVIVTMVDISDQVRTIEELKRSEARLAEALDRARLGCWHYEPDADDGWWSPQMFDLFYRDPALGEPKFDEYVELIHPDDRSSVGERFSMLLKTGLMESFEVRTNPARGPMRYLSHSLMIESGVDKRSEGITGWVLDISERKRDEDRRRAMEDRLRNAQKLESLAVLAGGVAHDFNNLLFGIMGHANLALLDLPDDSLARSHLQDIELSVNRAADLCQQMLAYSGRGHFVVEPVDLNRLISEMSGLLEASISKRVSTKLHLDSELPAIDADVTQIRQVMMNLIINASEAMEQDGGQIVVTTGSLEASRDYLAGSYLDDDLPAGLYVFLEVADSGSGMNEQTLAQVFEPFFSSKFAGRGLGLAAVLGIVRGHKGAIVLHSEPGQGTTFRVLLPAASERSKVQPEPPAVPKQWQGSGTFLVVDDEPSVSQVVSLMLERLGYSVLQAFDGIEAVDMVRQHADDLSFILLDLSMPRMGGLEASEQILKIAPHIKIIFSSGFNEPERISFTRGDKATCFVQKPYHFEALKEIVRRVCGAKPALKE